MGKQCSLKNTNIPKICLGPVGLQTNLNLKSEECIPHTPKSPVNIDNNGYIKIPEFETPDTQNINQFKQNQNINQFKQSFSFTEFINPDNENTKTIKIKLR